MKVPVAEEDINHVKSILHLHFPEEFSGYFDPKTRAFKFALGICLKYSIVKTLIGWNTQPVFNNILYDGKFVALLLTFITGKENLQNNHLPKEQSRFIRGMYLCIDIVILSQKFNFYKSHHFSNIPVTSWGRSAPCRSLWWICARKSVARDEKDSMKLTVVVKNDLHCFFETFSKLKTIRIKMIGYR